MSHTRAKEIFLDAIDLPADQQLNFATRACHDDHALRREVEEMLRLHHDAAHLLERPAARIDQSLINPQHAPTAGRLNPGDVIDRYRLLRLVGEGGFGSVYLAQQTEPVVREVALKVIKRGMDTDQVIARFALERQALALMDHPGIARVFDAGATGTGQPYFVMEYVDGRPITQYCEQERLRILDRLELIEQVCLAVQHAHQKGIIHRDIKPGNILVTDIDGRAVPKVIDFGVAKATDPEMPHSSALTLEVQIVGTPQYMAPEQAQTGATEIDTRTDVYSLGTVMYELITGAPPFDPQVLRDAGIDGMCRMIREQTPLKPSARAAIGATETRLWRKQISPEIDWIVIRALEKEPARRYQSPAELAADIRRHLAHEAVLAGPPSRLYQFRKFARRHRKSLAAAAGIVLLLLATAIVSTVMAQRARRAEAEAKIELARANTIVDFTKDLLSGIAPSVARGRDTALLHDLLERSIEKADTGLGAEPTIELSVRNIIGGALNALGDEDAAIAQLQRIFQATRDTPQRDDPQRIRAGLTIASILAGRYETDPAQKFVTECIESLKRTGREDSEDGYEARQAQAAVYMHSQRHVEAEALLRSILDHYRRIGKGETEPALRAWNNLALTIYWQQRWAESAAQWKELNAVDRRVYGENHPYTLMTLVDIGSALQAQGQFDDAEKAFYDALAVARQVYDPAHPTLLTIMNNLGALLVDRGKLDPAEKILQEGYDAGSRKLQLTDSPLDVIFLQLGKLRFKQGRYDEAVQHVAKLHDAVAAKYGSHQRKTLSLLVYLFRYQIKAGRAAEGIQMMQQLGEIPQDAGNDVRESVYASAGKLHLAVGDRVAAQRFCDLARSAVGRDDQGHERPGVILRELEEMLRAPTTAVGDR